MNIVKSVSIVLLGDFNPIIFQPFWFSNKGLIREEESEKASVSIIHNQIVRFDLDWASFEITTERFEAKTTKETYFNPLKDIVISIFTILSETPITELGINNITNFSLENQDNYYRFGHWLCNLSLWNDAINDPLLLSLEVFNPERDDKESGSQRIRVTPSDLAGLPYAVSINFNDHFKLNNSTRKDIGRNSEIIRLLEENWEKSFKKSTSISSNIWDKFQRSA